jgi:hypothetical protein
MMGRVFNEVGEDIDPFRVRSCLLRAAVAIDGTCQ